jgi:hypothetical protein
MKVKIRNSPDKRLTPYIRRATIFFGKILIPSKRIYNNITLSIIFNKRLKDFGNAGIEDCNTNNKPREFSIQIHPGIGARSIFETLAHEMVHVKQFALQETDDQLSTWKNSSVDTAKIDYWWHPWEIEAHGMEPGLLTKFVIQEKLYDVLEGFNNPEIDLVEVPIVWKPKSIEGGRDNPIYNDLPSNINGNNKR